MDLSTPEGRAAHFDALLKEAALIEAPWWYRPRHQKRKLTKSDYELLADKTYEEAVNYAAMARVHTKVAGDLRTQRDLIDRDDDPMAYSEADRELDWTLHKADDQRRVANRLTKEGDKLMRKAKRARG